MLSSSRLLARGEVEVIAKAADRGQSSESEPVPAGPSPAFEKSKYKTDGEKLCTTEPPRPRTRARKVGCRAPAGEERPAGDSGSPSRRPARPRGSGPPVSGPLRPPDPRLVPHTSRPLLTAPTVSRSRRGIRPLFRHLPSTSVVRPGPAHAV